MSTIVLQIEATNAGVWPIHCHIAWHVSQGLFVQFIEQRDSIKRLDPERDQRQLQVVGCVVKDPYGVSDRLRVKKDDGQK